MKNFNVKVLEYKPHLVTIELVDHGKEMKVPRLGFERRKNLGVYTVLNPETLPKYY